MPSDGPPLPELTHSELIRYSRHLLLPGVGLEGQRRLKAARVLVVGAGGLGSPSAMYLAAAGIGTIGLVDFDLVDLSNLQRQIIHSSAAVGTPKLESAAARLREINPHSSIRTFATRLTAENALDILAGFDIILDGSDNFPTRYLINDACVLLGKPYVYGSILRFDGQVSLFSAREGPCYRCLFAEPPPPGLVPSCAEGGVLGVLPGIIGSIQALEAIKWILGTGETLLGRLLLLEALTMKTREIRLKKDPACPACGESPTITGLIDYDAFCGMAHDSRGELEVSPEDLKREMAGGVPPSVIDVREPYEWEFSRIEGARLVPLGDLGRRLGELDPHQEIVTYCHHGVRSLQAAELLRSAGFMKVRSLAGGIDAWAREVSPETARY
jgi:molybdopterin/thiamine biosynthesis adenylyltransferase/rhodanese-related sulfurtransferase